MAPSLDVIHGGYKITFEFTVAYSMLYTGVNMYTIGGIVSKETVWCVGGKVKH